MISQETLQFDWIKKTASTNHNADKIN